MESCLILILMGVSGSGKTTIGALLAHDLAWPFYDGDDFHPPANIERMSRGVALTDDDRSAWLASVRQLIDRLLHEGQSAVIACSALKQSYRERLKDDDEEVQFVYLKGNPETIQQRLQERSGHFMKVNLLTSQFETLEEPEGALTVDISQEPATLVSAIRQALGL